MDCCVNPRFYYDLVPMLNSCYNIIQVKNNHSMGIQVKWNTVDQRKIKFQVKGLQAELKMVTKENIFIKSFHLLSIFVYFCLLKDKSRVYKKLQSYKLLNSIIKLTLTARFHTDSQNWSNPHKTLKIKQSSYHCWFGLCTD